MPPGKSIRRGLLWNLRTKTASAIPHILLQRNILLPCKNSLQNLILINGIDGEFDSNFIRYVEGEIATRKM